MNSTGAGLHPRAVERIAYYVEAARMFEGDVLTGRSGCYADVDAATAREAWACAVEALLQELFGP